MRNKYAGKCYICGGEVKVGEGFFQRSGGKWITKHATGKIEEAKKCKNSVANKKLQ